MNEKTKIRKYINETAEKMHPGIRNYYLKFVADEITDQVLRNAHDQTYTMNLKGIQDVYQLNKIELYKVLYLLKEDTSNIENIVLKAKVVDLSLPSKYCAILQADAILQHNFKDTYDEVNQGVLFFGNSRLNGLIFSSSQASKVSRDLTYCMEDNMVLSDPLSNEKLFQKTLHAYSEYYKNMQIEGILQMRADAFVDEQGLKDDEWIEYDSAFDNVKAKLQTFNPNYVHQDLLSSDDRAFTAGACDQEISRQKELEKELDLGDRL